MNIANSYSAPGILQPSFAATEPPYTEMTTQTVHIPTPNTTTTTTSSIQPTNDYHLERVKKSQVILEKYPDRVPLIIQPSKNDKDLYPIDKSKYITPRRFDVDATPTNYTKTRSISAGKGALHVYK